MMRRRCSERIWDDEESLEDMAVQKRSASKDSESKCSESRRISKLASTRSVSMTGFWVRDAEGGFPGRLKFQGAEKLRFLDADAWVEVEVPGSISRMKPSPNPVSP